MLERNLCEPSGPAVIAAKGETRRGGARDCFTAMEEVGERKGNTLEMLRRSIDLSDDAEPSFGTLCI